MSQEFYQGASSSIICIVEKWFQNWRRVTFELPLAKNLEQGNLTLSMKDLIINPKSEVVDYPTNQSLEISFEMKKSVMRSLSKKDMMLVLEEEKSDQM